VAPDEDQLLLFVGLVDLINIGEIQFVSRVGSLGCHGWSPSLS
jgi:hypothetical protein